MRDIPEHGVKKGDLGGWIESEENLSQDGCCWIGDEATVCANAKVEHGAIVRGHAAVVGDAWVQGRATVDGYAVVSEGAWIKDDEKDVLEAVLHFVEKLKGAYLGISA